LAGAPSPDTPAGKSISLRGNDYQNPKPFVLGVLLCQPSAAPDAGSGRLSLFLLQFAPCGGGNRAADWEIARAPYRTLRECEEWEFAPRK
jgi:hypothetical protein